MVMMLDKLIQLLPSKPVYAHCDIPCGIYDPHAAQMAAHTVIRMTMMIKDLEASSIDAPFEERKQIIHQISRLTKVKEDHAEILKHEVTVIWGDYFKEENSKHVDNLADHVWQTLKLASKAKQEINLEVAKALLAHVQVFAEMFWQSKGMDPVRIPSGYPTEGEIVSHK